MSSSSQVVESWISGFCNLLGHEYFAEVSEDFIEDDFNLTGLSSQVPMYKEALEMILDVEPEDESEELDEEEEEDDDEGLAQDGLQFRRAADRIRNPNDVTVIESSAELLYGLIHQRFITSRAGIQQMHEKYEMGHFGQCPRVHCNSCKVLPVGCSDTPGEETVKLFCPSCLDVYIPPNSRFQTVDGAFFGTTFGCLFLMSYPDLQFGSRRFDPSTPGSSENKELTLTPSRTQPTEINGISTATFAPGLGPTSIYESRIYGFRVSEKARSGPRMRWLRMKPDDVRDLDETKRFHFEELDEDDMIEDEPQESPQPPTVDQRKKAPIKRRRRFNSDNHVAPTETNGVNGIG